MLFPWVTSARKRFLPSGGASPAFGGEVQRDNIYLDAASEDHTLVAGIPAGSVAVVLFTNGAGLSLTGATDTKGNSWTVRQSATDGYTYTAVATANVTSALLTGDKITLGTTSAYGQRVVSICYISNATYDTSATAAPYASAVSVPGTTSAGVAVGVISSSGSASQTYSGGAWTTIGSYTDYGFTRRAYFVYQAVTAGSQNPGGSWSETLQQCNVWVSGK